MRRTEFLATVKGQEYAYFRRRFKILYLKVEQEPETKAISNQGAKFFRQSVREQIREWKRRAFIGDIAIEISFHSAAKVPQPVQTLVKNYLDLLHKPMPGVDKLERILFNDDNQVKLLVANHYHGFGDPQISIKVYPFRNFVKDVEYADYILHDRFVGTPYGLWSGFEIEKRTFDYFPSFRELLREYDDFKKRHLVKPHPLPIFQEDHFKRQLQESYLKENSLRIDQLLGYLKDIFEQRKDAITTDDDRIRIWLRDYMFIGLDFIPMGGAPIKEGQSKSFQKHIEAQLNGFVQKHDYLFPLLRPAGLTIVVIPPAYRCPDADNLARRIVPFFDKVCQPPMSHTTLPGVRTGRKEKVWIATSSYQILYLPRGANDPEDGQIMLLVDQDFLSLSSVWAKVDKVIEKWEDYIKYKHF